MQPSYHSITGPYAIVRVPRTWLHQGLERTISYIERSWQSSDLVDDHGIPGLKERITDPHLLRCIGVPKLDLFIMHFIANYWISPLFTRFCVKMRYAAL